MSYDERAYLKSVVKAHSMTSVGGNCQWCGTPAPCKALTEAIDALSHEARRAYERTLLVEFLIWYDPEAVDSDRCPEAVDDFLSERYDE